MARGSRRCKGNQPITSNLTPASSCDTTLDAFTDWIAVILAAVPRLTLYSLTGIARSNAMVTGTFGPPGATWLFHKNKKNRPSEAWNKAC